MIDNQTPTLKLSIQSFSFRTTISNATVSSRVKLVHDRAALWISTSGDIPAALLRIHLTILQCAATVGYISRKSMLIISLKDLEEEVENVREQDWNLAN